MDGNGDNDAADNGSADGMGGAVGNAGNQGNGGTGPDGGFGDATIGATVGDYGGAPSMGFDTQTMGTVTAISSPAEFDKDPFGIGISKDGLIGAVSGLTLGAVIDLTAMALDLAALSAIGTFGTIAGPAAVGGFLGANPTAVADTVDALGAMGRDSGFMDGGL